MIFSPLDYHELHPLPAKTFSLSSVASPRICNHVRGVHLKTAIADNSTTVIHFHFIISSIMGLIFFHFNPALISPFYTFRFFFLEVIPRSPVMLITKTPKFKKKTSLFSSEISVLLLFFSPLPPLRSCLPAGYTVTHYLFAHVLCRYFAPPLALLPEYPGRTESNGMM